MRMRFLASRFLRERLNIPGKWLIFWCCYILRRVSGSTCQSVHQMSHSGHSASFFILNFSSLATRDRTSYSQSWLEEAIPVKLMMILSNRMFWAQLALNFGGIGSPCCLSLSLSSRAVFYFSLFFRFITDYNLITITEVGLLIHPSL